MSKEPVGETYTLTVDGVTIPPIPYDVSPAQAITDFQKRKLALQLTEHIDHWIDCNGDLDVDAAAEYIAPFIPSTRFELEEELKEYTDNVPRSFAPLRKLLCMEEAPLREVVEMASSMLAEYNDLERFDVALLGVCTTVEGWHSYIRRLLDEAHEWYQNQTRTS